MDTAFERRRCDKSSDITHHRDPVVANARTARPTEDMHRQEQFFSRL